jgi:hypothetical protein
MSGFKHYHTIWTEELEDMTKSQSVKGVSGPRLEPDIPVQTQDPHTVRYCGLYLFGIEKIR